MCGRGGDVEQCLSEVSPLLQSLISVWSAAEQRSIGEAFMKVTKLAYSLFILSQLLPLSIAMTITMEESSKQLSICLHLSVCLHLLNDPHLSSKPTNPSVTH